MDCNGSIQISSQLYPAFYTKFQCIAERCQDNCCHAWKISFSQKDYFKIKRAEKSKELQTLTKQAMCRFPEELRTENEYGKFIAQDGPCLFQNEQGLCRLQLECGHGTLPEPCRQFPRTMAYTSMGLEKGLSTACEAVVKLLWELPEGIDFVMEPLEKQQWRTAAMNGRAKDFPVFRSALIDILQARQFSLSRRILILGVAIEKIVQQWDILDIDLWQRQVQMLCEDVTLTAALENLSSNRGAFLSYNIQLLATAVVKQNSPLSELLKQNKVIQVSYAENGLHIECNELEYKSALQKFNCYFEKREYFFENVLVNTAYNICIPHCVSAEKMWESYIWLCNIYSFFQFLAVILCDQKPTKERLFESVVRASRVMLHNEQRQSYLYDKLLSNKSTTLAHMAVLVKG